MSLQYLTDPIVNGKWYVSQFPKGQRESGQSKSRRDATVSGPFDNQRKARKAKVEIEREFPELKDQLYVWQPKS